MTFEEQIIAGIKEGLTRMDMAEKYGMKPGGISRLVNRISRDRSFRAAGITDQEFAYWEEASLIGLRDENGDLVIERTEPDPAQVEFNLRCLQDPIVVSDAEQAMQYMLQGYRIRYAHEPKNNPTGDIGVTIRNCTKCKHYAYDSRCPRRAYEWNITEALNCRAYQPRSYIPKEWWKK